ncbi:MAG: GDP-mannose 4,6-dehydratase, partial [Pseudomonadota bacterium]
MTTLVTGVAGFIGSHVAQALLAKGEQVIGLDSLNVYYDVALKKARLANLQNQSGFTFHKVNIADRNALKQAVSKHQDIDRVVHLAAQAGVRYSLTNPEAYGEANLIGHLNMLELARALPNLKHMVYASSSSVYGANTKLPFSVVDPVDQPMSLYAATKRSSELMSHTYTHLYQLPLTGL